VLAHAAHAVYCRNCKSRSCARSDLSSFSLYLFWCVLNIKLFRDFCECLDIFASDRSYIYGRHKESKQGKYRSACTCWHFDVEIFTFVRQRRQNIYCDRRTRSFKTWRNVNMLPCRCRLRCVHNALMQGCVHSAWELVFGDVYIVPARSCYWGHRTTWFHVDIERHVYILSECRYHWND